MMRALSRAVLPLLILACGTAAEAQTFIGPLRIRDQSPLSLFRLDLPPAHAVNDVESGWGIEIEYSHSNLFLASFPVEEWLAARGGRRPITEDDVAEILALPGDVFLFDGEVSSVHLTASWALDRNWQASVTVPFHWYGGGYLDRLIENFHDAVGIGQAGREFVLRDEVQVFARLGDGEPILVTGDGDAGWGDAVLTLRYGRPIAPAWHLIAEAAAKVPTGRQHLYFSKENPDFGAQLSLQHLRERTGYYASLSWIAVGDDPLFPDVSDTPTIALALERKIWNGEISLIGQATWSRSTIAGIERSDLTEDRTQISIGLRKREGPLTASIALTENVAQFDNTPDIGVHVGLGWISIGK